MLEIVLNIGLPWKYTVFTLFFIFLGTTAIFTNSYTSIKRNVWRDDERHEFKWGFKDTKFSVNVVKDTVTLSGNRYPICGYEMPYFMQFLRDELQITNLELDQIRPEKKYIAANQKINSDLLRDLNQFSISYLTDNKTRSLHSCGQTGADELQKILYSEENLAKEVDIVVYPETEENIIALIELGKKYNLCLIPYGGGTNVTKALCCPDNEDRLIVSVDMKYLNHFIEYDKGNNLVSFESGITGREMEVILNEMGLTSGHEPDSIEFSTLGGWIATNASGMKQSKYGNIEQIVVNYRLWTSEGLITKDLITPRNSHGIDCSSVVFGSEGNLGIITSATIKVHKLPQSKIYESIVFKDFYTGVAFLSDLRSNKPELVPASIRLIDNKQYRFAQALKPAAMGIKKFSRQLTKLYLHNWCSFEEKKIVACTLALEGDNKSVKEQLKGISKLAKKYNGIMGGAENGEKGYQLTYAIAYIRDLLSQYYIIGETFETSVKWNDIRHVCEAVDNRLLKETSDMSTKPFLSYRVTQTYDTGVCIYFMLGYSHKDIVNPTEHFNHLEHALRDEIIKEGGSISHHHGIGKIRKKFLLSSTRSIDHSIIKSVKKTLDPANIFGVSNGLIDN